MKHPRFISEEQNVTTQKANTLRQCETWWRQTKSCLMKRVLIVHENGMKECTEFLNLNAKVWLKVKYLKLSVFFWLLQKIYFREFLFKLFDWVLNHNRSIRCFPSIGIYDLTLFNLFSLMILSTSLLSLQSRMLMKNILEFTSS